MEATTLFIAILASLLVLFVRPANAFAVYLTSMIIYPSYLVMLLGELNIGVGRIVVGVLLLRCLANAHIRKSFKWCTIDSWMISFMVLSWVVPLIAWQWPIPMIIQRQSGYTMDTLAAYFAARYCITRSESVIGVAKWIGILLVPVAVLGVIESLSGWQPYLPLAQYCPWRPEGIIIEPRSGLTRAMGAFGHPIMFGICLALFLPLVYSLRNDHSYWRSLAYIVFSIIVLGIMSSMSSGPVMMVVLIVFFLFMERYEQWIKPLFWLSVVACIFVATISNRPIYHVVVSYINPIGGTGWHRVKLIDLAIEHFGDWWFTGYGGRDPGWGQALGMTWTDITNEYIVFGVQYGILGIVVFVGLLCASILKLYRLLNSTLDPALKSFYWAMGSMLVALIISFNSFTLFGQTHTIFFCILGIIGSLGSVQVKLSQTKHGREASRVTQTHISCQPLPGEETLNRVYSRYV